MSDIDDRRLGLGDELAGIEAAEAALGNAAVMDYFRDVESQAIDALLNCDLLDDALRLKLTVVAQQCRKLREYLEQKRDLRALIEDELKALEGA